MRLQLGVVLAVVLAVPSAGAPVSAPRGGQKRWIVTFKPQVKREGREKALASLGVKAAAHVATDGDSENEFSAAVVDLPEGRVLRKSISFHFSLGPRAEDDIVSIEEDRSFRWIETTQTSFQTSPMPSLGSVMGSLNFPRDERFPLNPLMFALFAKRPELTWGINRVHAPAAWDVTEAEGVKIAVIDTGIDASHPDLVGKVDGGYSAIKKTENPEDYADDNRDGHGHGTHVAGTIAAWRDGKGVVGVAPKARLYAVKVLDKDGSGRMSDVVDGIVWAGKNRMQVANMSLGAPVTSEALQSAVRYASSRGVILVAAAGNAMGGPVSYPGALPEVIAVSASSSQDRFAPFSSRGPQVKFIAPGWDVVSAQIDGGFASLSGTSMACPHVAGLAALVVSQGYVGLTGPDGVLAQLVKAAKPLVGLKPEEQGFGMIDAGRLVH